MSERATEWVREREGSAYWSAAARLPQPERRGTYAGCSAARLLALSCASCLRPYTYTQRCRASERACMIFASSLSLSGWLLELLFSREQEGVVSRKWGLSEFELRVTHVLPSIHTARISANLTRARPHSWGPTDTRVPLLCSPCEFFFNAYWKIQEHPYIFWYCCISLEYRCSS
jgi:hypothetical protein